MKAAIPPLTLLLVLATPAAFAAEDIYRSTMPDGRILYGESPFPGAQSVRKIPPPPISTGTIVVTPAEQSRGVQPLPDRGRGGVVILPQAARESPRAAQQGRLQSDSQQLPRRTY